MTFLLDHCIWRQTENFLKQSGFQCVTLREIGKAEAANGEIIATAKERKSILTTRDRDFSNLSLYPLGSHEGIILLRIQPNTTETVHKILLECLHKSSEHLPKSLTIVTSTTYRIHSIK